MLLPSAKHLRAAMVRMARPRDDVIFVDPFCGSGTTAVEAALLADGIAPGAAQAGLPVNRFPFFRQKSGVTRARRQKAGSVKAGCIFMAQTLTLHALN